MISHFLVGSTLLRPQQSRLPQTFRRYKSLTAAIERGRQGGPDRPFRHRTQAAPEQDGDGFTPNRRGRRLERFGPSKFERKTFNDSRRPQRDLHERSAAPRSSRFGRVGPPRSRDNLPSRYEDYKPERPSLATSRPTHEDSEKAYYDKFNSSEETPVSSRPDGAEMSGNRSEPRQSREDRYGRSKDRYGRSDERPPRREGGFEARERRPFEARERKPHGDRETKSYGDRETKSYGDRERKPYGDRERKPFEDRERKPYDRDNKFNDTRSRFSDRSTARDFPQRGGYEARSERSTGAGRTFRERDGASSFSRGRPDKEPTGRYSPRDSPRDQPDTAGRATGDAGISRTSIRDVESLPYTTAASEFIYGFSSVLAALKANRRKLYNIYVHSRGASRDGLLTRIRALKLFPITNEVGDEYLRAMDKASSGRPHNGVILESSPLPVLPITELKTASVEDASFSVGVGSQSAEDALVNGKQDLYSYKAAGWRHPLILYVDGVLDEGNLGAIARSAYFLGVDAIITPTRQSAPWSHIAVKASAGAAEAIPIFKVSEPTDFLGKSARAGWRIYASDSIPPLSSTDTAVQDESSSSNIIYTIPRSTKRLPSDHCPVAESPTILMMGAEGAGLRDSLLNLAHYKVGIRQGREVDEVGVDSLNVSVAASLLCYEMLQKPIAKPAPNPEEVLF